MNRREFGDRAPGAQPTTRRGGWPGRLTTCGARLRRKARRAWTQPDQGRRQRRGVWGGGRVRSTDTRTSNRDGTTTYPIVHQVITACQRVRSESRDGAGAEGENPASTGSGQAHGDLGVSRGRGGNGAAWVSGAAGGRRSPHRGMCPLFQANVSSFLTFFAECVQFGGRCVHFGGACVQSLAAWRGGRRELEGIWEPQGEG